MGLNEILTDMRGHILLMDLLPPISKIFNLIVQEERQRNIRRDGHTKVMACASSDPSVADALGQGKPKTRPVCSHCRLSGHTVDRCYKLHGYPPGFKPKTKAHDVLQTNPSVQQPNLQRNILSYKGSRPGSVCEVQAPPRRVRNIAKNSSPSPVNSSAATSSVIAPSVTTSLNSDQI